MSNKVIFTPQQLQAINEENKNILVSAAAGCGKTTLMVQRIIRKLIEEDINIDQLVIVTFTEAAASQLIHRIKVEIIKNDNLKLKKQLQLLDNAYISTLHSLCLRLLKENQVSYEFNQNIQISSDLSISILKDKAYDNLYKNNINNKDFSKLDIFYNSLSNNTRLHLVLDNFVSFIDGNSNLKQLESFNNNQTTYNTVYDIPVLGQLLSDFFNEHLNTIKDIYQSVLNIDDTPKLIDCLNEYLPVIDQAIIFNNNKQFNELINLLPTISTRFRLYSKALDYTKHAHEQVKKITKLLDGFSLFNNDQLLDINYSSNEFFMSVYKYSLMYKDILFELKKEEGLLEFSDLETLTIKMLYDDNDNPTNISLKLKDYFKEIMIDEYQDTNLIQEKIAKGLSNGSNMFMVGDLKQSIYRFRKADSRLFTSKYYDFQKDSNGCVIDLYSNFRSKNEVLEMTNFIFMNTFSKDIGGIDYDNNARLNFGNKDLDKIQGDFKTKILSHISEETDLRKIDQSIINSKMIVEEIKKLRENNVDYKDIVVLSRGRKGLDTLARYLEEANIPSMFHTENGFYSSTHIKDLISLLQLLINPHDDLHMIEVLRSMFFNYTDQDLYDLSLKRDQYQSYFSLCDDNIKEVIYDLISYKNNHSIVEIIDYIYQKTNYLSHIQSMNNLKQFHLNLLAFKNIISNDELIFNSYDKHINSLAQIHSKNFNSITPALVSNEMDVVNVLTIHKSKGLEFKYVFLFNVTDFRIGNQFDDYKEINNKILFNYTNDSKYVKIDNTFKHLYKYYETKENIAEELRILYVALTRAQLQLYICNVTNHKKLEEYYNNISLSYNWLLPQHVITNMKSFKDIILSSILRHKDASTLREYKSLSINDEVFKYYDHLFDIIDYNNLDDTLDLTKSDNQIINDIRYIEHLDNSIKSNNFDLKPSSIQEYRLDFNNLNPNRFVQGNLVHELFESVNFKSDHLNEEVKSLINKLDIKDKYQEGIINFFESDLFKLCLSNEYYQEYPFVYLDKDNNLINGIIDLLIILDNEVIIIDYKSNIIEASELKDKYTKQITIYKEVINNIYKKKTSGYLYSIYHSNYILID